jgi:hypothetical protein
MAEKEKPSRYGWRGNGDCDRCPNVGNLFHVRAVSTMTAREYDTMVCADCRDKIRSAGLDRTPTKEVQP